MTYSADVRVMCLRAWQQLGSCRKTAKLLGLGRATVQRWVKDSFIRRRSAQIKKVTPDVLREILATVEACPFGTPSAVAEAVKHQLGVRLSGSCVRFWMRRSGISRKKAPPFGALEERDRV